MNNLYAIHSVFILKENILFLEQWIDYHIQLGFNKFYLYDNSKVTRSCGCHPLSKNFKVGKINKYGVNYDSIVNLNEQQMIEIINQIKLKYKEVDIIEWSPTDDDGNILFNQKDAHNHCLARMKNNDVKWCANIDMDEYIVIKDFKNIQDYIHSLDLNIYSIKMSQHRFESRFKNINNLVVDITNKSTTDLPLWHSNKYIYNVNKTISLNIHDCKGTGVQLFENINKLWFNHYKLCDKSYVYCNNIDPYIKSKIIKNSKNYININ